MSKFTEIMDRYRKSEDIPPSHLKKHLKDRIGETIKENVRILEHRDCPGQFGRAVVGLSSDGAEVQIKYYCQICGKKVMPDNQA